MTTVHREREAKFEGAGRFDPRILRRLTAVAHVREEEPEELDAVYYDTTDLRLLTHGVTLRRRSGGHDAGWHIKLPANGSSRTEVHAPLNAGRAGTVPGELLRRTAAYARGAELAPVAHMRTHRRRYLLLDKRKRCLAEVAQDAVAAQTLDPQGHETPGEPGGGRTRITQWSEVEVELVDGGPDLLDAAARCLESAGWHRSPSAHKLDHALADELAATGGSAGRTEKADALPSGSAGEAVMNRLRQQLDELLAVDPGVRADQHEAVHRMRSAARRSRNLLRGQRRLLDRSRTDPVADELRWLIHLLAAARDHEVIAERLAAQAEALRQKDPALRPALKGLAKRVRKQERARHDAAWRTASEQLDGARYFALLDALDGLLADPPLRGRAGKSAAKQLRKTAERDGRRLRKRLVAAEHTPEGAERAKALHSVRKAARRARHTAETARPYTGKRARVLRKRTKAVQQLLGEHQDAVVARKELLFLAAEEARRPGADTFGHGLLYAAQTDTARAARERLPRVGRKAAKPRLTRLT
ncbi:CHAD domain-containing protein [Streptomyces sp. NPDC008139]|uniref:CYTH and CHAD domain-containing protein n=1 Tax=Streptomyces sp. NPDC008139 TaxID=3364814 RepID=UPI0036E8E4D5